MDFMELKIGYCYQGQKILSEYEGFFNHSLFTIKMID